MPSAEFSRKLNEFFHNNWWLIVMVGLGCWMLGVQLTKIGGLDEAGNLIQVGPDHLMHLAYIQELQQHFPPENPLFAGDRLYNYHFGSDLLVAVIANLTGVSAWVLYFKVMPWVYLLGLGLAAFWLSREIFEKKAERVVFLFLVYFGSSFSFVADLVTEKDLLWDDALGVSQPATYINNVPLTVSMVLVLLVLAIMAGWQRRFSVKKAVGLGLLLLVLPITKTYGGLVAYMLVGFMGVVYWLRGRRQAFWRLAVVAGLGGLAGFLIGWLNAHEPGGLVWLAFHPLKRFIESPNFVELTGRLQFKLNYWQMSGQWLKQGLVYGAALVIYLVGNLGSRVVGGIYELVRLKRERSRLSPLALGLWLTGLVVFLLPMFFIQQTGGFNITQLYQYGLLFVSIAAAKGWVGWFDKLKARWQKVVVGLSFVGLTLPGAVGVWWHNFASKPEVLSKERLEVMGEIGQLVESDKVILLEPSLAENVYYVSALTGRRVYLEALEYPRIQGHKVEERVEKVREVFDKLESVAAADEVKRLLGEERIGVIISRAETPLFEGSGLEIYGERDDLRIYRVE